MGHMSLLPQVRGVLRKSERLICVSWNSEGIGSRCLILVKQQGPPAAGFPATLVAPSWEGEKLKSNTVSNFDDFTGLENSVTKMRSFSRLRGLEKLRDWLKIPIK